MILQHTVDDQLGEVLGDERKFKQILLNLLSNGMVQNATKSEK
jgi:hypothetical protein